MSTWGTGPFANDDAAAWADELDAVADPVALAERTLAERGATDEPDPAAANRVVAAAAWLLSGLPGVAPVDPDDGPSATPTTPDPTQADVAGEALTAVLTDASWAEQWDSPEQVASARALVHGLLESWEVVAG